MRNFKFFCIIIILFAASGLNYSQSNTVKLSNPKSDVFMQAFYWNSPPAGIWWDSLAALAPRIASAGFSSVWVPSAVKGAGGSFSMGYDPYDHYDFGEFFQKGSRETRFGSRTELENMISTFHNAGVEVYADAVMRHMMGGEQSAAYECIPLYNGSPIVPDSAYLIFNYPAGSGRFKKSPASFYPNSVNCWVDPRFVQTDPLFRFGEWLDHNKQSVRDSLVIWGNYLKNVIGFDGFRIDAVKPIDPVFMAYWLNNVNSGGYAVAELWGSTQEISDWLNTVNANGADVAMFDFPLRYSLKEMCDNTSGTYDMNWLDGAGLVNSGLGGFDISTFVENHDFDRIGWDGEIDNGHSPIINDKQMAYAYTIFSEGRPAVFFKDYFDYGFSGKIDTLIWIRQNYIFGGTTKRSGLNPWYVGSGSQSDLSKDIYVARRDGGSGHPAVYLVMNDSPAEWRGVWVNSDYPNQVFRDYTGVAIDKISASDGRVELYAPPRGYAIYVPDTTLMLNNPPVLNKIPDQQGYTNSYFNYKMIYNDVNGDQLNFNLSGNPQWLSVNSSGYLTGTPAYADTGDSHVIINISDNKGASVSDTFKVSVDLNFAPFLNNIPDTTIKATNRYQYQTISNDPDSDLLSYQFITSPAWLKVGEESGIISGTPAISDTGYYEIILSVNDGKGGADSTEFFIRVVENLDTLIATYGKPVLDGIITTGIDDWREEWLIFADSTNDSKWNPGVPPDNELYDIFSTWDSDSLYIGIRYILNDDYNTMMIYLDAGIEGGVTDFNSQNGYIGEYAKNFVFSQENKIDYFFADYYLSNPSFFRADSNNSYELTDKIFGVRGSDGNDVEIAIAWDDLYGLGAGLVPADVTLQIVSLIAGGLNYGGGDSAPDNPDVDGNAGPDSLLNLAAFRPDKDSDGIPDPTIFISTQLVPDTDVPSKFSLEQNYPNPFNPSTNISFSLAEIGFTQLKVYDVLGREVSVLVNEIMKPGTYTIRFNASGISSGVYFYSLTQNGASTVKKLMLLK
ncbi:MAG: DUF1939 domain-containing protein [Ignavibacteriales bacterium]|nr:DUF1939 domain-containing protein [Ignavibacteriales bacterium]MCF8315519.1 DUF1939 domain-containing protein [Ignavibacteriales bacterium]MCF8436951.1 DUF1939 domain-containing protein [Ignavibacteriales bacterium]